MRLCFTYDHDGALRGDGIRQYHYVDGEMHAGDVERCPEPECQWPRFRGMVTVTSGGRQITGILEAREGLEGRGLVVRTGDGMEHRAPLVTARRPEWGVYCPHGIKLIEAEPSEHTCQLPPSCDMSGDPNYRWCKACYPDGRKVSPWPCPEEGCTEDDFDREQQEQIDAYYEEIIQSYYD